MIKLLKRIVPAPIKLALRARLRNGRISLALPDREFLETVAIPFFANQEEIKTVLDVGTDWYTWRYHTLFPGKTYHSIDFDPAKAKFAVKANHVTGSILELSDHFSPNQFDLIMCNGVLGWGVNQPDDIVTALDQFAICLKPGGYLILGWNDNDEHRPIGLDEALKSNFTPFELPPLGSDFHDTESANRHLFRFCQLKESS